jgi:hypothetical protein
MHRTGRLSAGATSLALVLAGLAGLLAGPGAAAEPPAACLAETFPTNRLRCLSEAAEAAGDPTLCLAAEEPGLRWMCVARVAEAAGEAEHCLVLPEAAVGPEGLGRELCRVHLAIAWKRPEYCEGLATANLEDACYLQMVEAGADAALCARIQNAVIKSACGGG